MEGLARENDEAQVDWTISFRPGTANEFSRNYIIKSIHNQTCQVESSHAMRFTVALCHTQLAGCDPVRRNILTFISRSL